MKELTPFHCWAEYWKAKEILQSTNEEALSKSSKFLLDEYNDLLDRVKEWAERHVAELYTKPTMSEIAHAIFRVYPSVFTAPKGLGYAVYYNDMGWVELGCGLSSESAWRDAYKNLKEKGDI